MLGLSCVCFPVDCFVYDFYLPHQKETMGFSLRRHRLVPFVQN
jgi:hypothetical protein